MSGPLRVVVVLYPGMVAQDAVGPVEAFGYVSIVQDDKNVGYEIDFVGLKEGPLGSMSGIKLWAEHHYSTYEKEADILLVPGMQSGDYQYRDEDFLCWIKEQALRSRRLVSVCTGAYVLAETGLLNGAEITTHWMHSATLHSKFPEIKVREDQVYMKDRNIYTSGGVTAGVDLALAIIAEDYDKALALKVAKRMVVYLRRPGNQAQYSDLLAAQSQASRFSAVIDWIEDNLGEQINIETLSDMCAMSARNFTRSFRAEVNLSPMDYVKRRRLERSKYLLEGTDMPYGRIASLVGFTSADRFSKAFKTVFDISPSDYRRRFGSMS